MSSQETLRQELPPPGGYKPVQWSRIPARQYLNKYFMIGGLLTTMATGIYIFSLSDKRNKRFALEIRSAQYAVLPLLQAQKDRAYLKQLKKNRDEEEKLMANVPGWVVGTLWGEPIFKSRPEDEWHDVTINEFYAHSRPRAFKRYTLTQKYH